jgi:HEAT repeat protein
MSSAQEMDRETKLALLTGIEEGEDYFTDYFPTIQAFLDDPDPEVRAQAVRCLWDYPRADLIDFLMTCAQEDPSQEVRSAALSVLGRYIYEGDMAGYDIPERGGELWQDELPQEDFERVKAFLLQVASDTSASLDSQRFALEALGFLVDDEVVKLIERAYNHPDVKMRMSAIFAMGRQGTRRWKDIILRELDSEFPELQFEAVRAAGESFLEEATPRLLGLATQTEDKDLRLAAIFALGKTGGGDVQEFLEDLMNDPFEDDDVREVAEAALEEWSIYHGLEDWDFLDDAILDD